MGGRGGDRSEEKRMDAPAWLVWQGFTRPTPPKGKGRADVVARSQRSARLGVDRVDGSAPLAQGMSLRKRRERTPGFKLHTCGSDHWQVAFFKH